MYLRFGINNFIDECHYLHLLFAITRSQAASATQTAICVPFGGNMNMKYHGWEQIIAYAPNGGPE